jgi:hypothetical protein
VHVADVKAESEGVRRYERREAQLQSTSRKDSRRGCVDGNAQVDGGEVELDKQVGGWAWA